MDLLFQLKEKTNGIRNRYHEDQDYVHPHGHWGWLNSRNNVRHVARLKFCSQI
jgi:hypothetical protein